MCTVTSPGSTVTIVLIPFVPYRHDQQNAIKLFAHRSGLFMDYVDPRIVTVTYRFSRNTKSQSAVDYSVGHRGRVVGWRRKLLGFSLRVGWYFLFFFPSSFISALNRNLLVAWNFRCNRARARSTVLSWNENFDDNNSAVRVHVRDGKGYVIIIIIITKTRKITRRIQIERHHRTDRW
jgi:hypothetical protein